jgi:NAD(P)-dependent dehydrogenase (short-subunit alcohol dehydrogenase family)
MAGVMYGIDWKAQAAQVDTINVTTSLSTMLFPGQAAYSVSKAGLEAVTAVKDGNK